MAYLAKGHASYNQTLLALFSGSFITFMILYSVQTLFPLFTAEFDVTPAIASLSLSVTTGFLAITMIAASFLSDSFGRKRMMSLSLFLSALFCIIASFSQDFTFFLLMRALQGIALAGFPAVAMAYVSEEFHPGNLGVAMGIYVSGTAFGGLSGRLITGILTSYFSWETALLSIGLISLLLSLWFVRALPEPKQSERKSAWNIESFFTAFTYNLKEKKLLALFGISFLLMGGFVTLYNYLGFYLMADPFNLSQAAIGVIFIIYLVGTFSSTFMGRLSDMAGKKRMLPVSLLIMLSGVLITLSGPLSLILIGLAVFTFGFFGSHSIASNWVGELATIHRAQATSLYLLAYYLGSSIMGTVGGFIWDSSGWHGVILLVSSLTGIALMLVVVVGFSGAKKGNA